MIAVSSHSRGVILPVLAHPSAKRAGVMGERASSLRIAVTAPPEKGKANEAIQAVLAVALGCKTSNITLLSGDTSRRKRFLIEGMNADDLSRRLAALTGDSESSRDRSSC